MELTYVHCLITAKGHPLPQLPCPVDMPDDFFRLRLVCVLLDTCGMCFDRGSQKRKLDNFLVFFQVCLVLYFFLERIDDQITQYYVLCKEPMPMDVEFMVTDSLEAIRPKLTLSKNIEDAATAVDEMFASSVQGSGRGYPRFRCVHVILTYLQLAPEKAAVMIVVTRENAPPMMKRRTRMRTRQAPSTP
jgi:hypothetical protein